METTLAKGLKMLEAVAASDHPRGVSELGRQIGLTRSNAHRLLQTLSALGYLRHDPQNGQYESTLRLFELGSSVVLRYDIRTVAQPVMQRLARELDENVLLSVRDGNEVLAIERIESTRTLRTFTPLGARRPMHCTSPGKLLLAYAPAEVVEAVARSLTKLTPRTIGTREKLLAELERIRARGYAMARSELHEDICGVSVPLGRGDRTIVAGLTLSGPAGRFKLRQIKAYVPHLLAAASRIDEALGYPGRRASGRA